MNKIDSKRRFVSLWFPLLPLETITKNRPKLENLPLCIYLSSDKDKIICANQSAKNLGIKEGMSPKEARVEPETAVDKVLDLFLELGADDDQCDFPYLFGSGIGGYAKLKYGTMKLKLKSFSL